MIAVMMNNFGSPERRRNFLLAFWLSFTSWHGAIFAEHTIVKKMQADRRTSLSILTSWTEVNYFQLPGTQEILIWNRLAYISCFHGTQWTRVNPAAWNLFRCVLYMRSFHMVEPDTLVRSLFTFDAPLNLKSRSLCWKQYFHKQNWKTLDLCASCCVSSCAKASMTLTFLGDVWQMIITG